MADVYQLAGLTLPPDLSHESLPEAVRMFLQDCWAGMSRTQMTARAKRRDMRLSFRTITRCPAGGSGLFELRCHVGAEECLMLASQTKLF
jgi:hypothetical protein